MSIQSPVSTRRMRTTVLSAVACIALTLVTATSAFAAGAAVFSGTAPAAGSAVLAKPWWVSVMSDDTAPVISASITVNGIPAFTQVSLPRSHWVYDDETETDYLVVDDATVSKIQSYKTSWAMISGTNTVVATVVSASGISTHTWTFDYVTGTTVTTLTPAPASVQAASPAVVSASVASPYSAFTSSMRIDGALVPTTYSAATKTFTHTPATALSPGTHTAVFTASATAGSATRTWSFTVRPPMSTGGDCANCHAAYAASHPRVGCASCHDRAYAPYGKHGGAIPTVAGCMGDGVNSGYAECHQFDHSGNMGAGLVGFACAKCHSESYPAVPRHSDASTTVAHVSATTNSTSCNACHSASLIAEHAKYPAAASIKYQCELCHGASAPQTVKDAVTAGGTTCGACHASADHESMHAVTGAPASCGATSCHPASSLTAVHAVPGCDGCHASIDPAVVSAIGTGNRDCTACHAGDPHPAAIHTSSGPCIGCHDANVSILHAAGPGCDACHALGKTPSLLCSTCHTGPLHPTVSHATDEVCDDCHTASNLTSVHADNCLTCHPTSAPVTWDGGCRNSSCHPPVHITMTPHQGEHGEGPDCWNCHDGESACLSCHNIDYHTPPVTTSDAVSSYVGTATVTLTLVSPGGSGTRATYYQLDGGAITKGTVIKVGPPATGAKSHTIEFWSIDMDFNPEVHKRASFSVSAP